MDELLPINCAKRGGRLVEALPSSSAYCKTCRQWSKAVETVTTKGGGALAPTGT